MIELKVMPWARGDKISSPSGGDEGRAIIVANSPQILELSKQLLLQHGARNGDHDAGLTLTIEFRSRLWERIA